MLTKDEVRKVIHHMNGMPRLMAMLLYGGGLRLMECCRLRVKDIDFSRDEIVVRAGKGDKDRHTMLPTAANERLLDTSNLLNNNMSAISIRLGPSRSAKRARAQIPKRGKRVGMAMGISCNTHFTDKITGE